MKDDDRSAIGNAEQHMRGQEGATPAERALAEAAERRERAAKQRETAEKEIDGPKGLEPTRYGDWEKGGIASDF